MRLATVHLNAQWGNGSLWPGCNISVSDVDSEGVPDIAALKCFKEALLPRPPSMFVGGRRSDVTTSVALIGRVTQTPTLSYSATSVGLTGLSRFARVVGSDGLQAKAILGFMCALRPRWREAVAITASSDYASSLVIALRAMADAQGVSISLEQHVPVAAAPLRDVLASINSALDRVVTRNARVIILNDEPADARLVLSEARRRGMIGLDQAPGSPYVWIGTDYWASEDAMFAAGNLTRLAQAGCPAACAERLLEALPGCFATWQSTRAIAPWLGPWQASVWDPAVGPDQLTPRQKAISELSSWRGDNMDTKAPFAFDAVLLAAAAMRRACEASGVPLASTGCGACASAFKNGDLMFNAMIGGSARPAFLVANATGPVFLDENGDRPMAVSLQQFTRVPNLTIPLDKVHVGELPVAAGPGEGCDGMVLQEAAIRWPGGRSTPPGTLGPCPPGQALSTGPFGAAYCGECPAGRFNMDLSSNCRPCPGVGAICPGGDVVELKVGFWSSPLRNGTVELYDCRPIPGICCPSSRCEVGRAMVDRPWGSSQCGPNRLGRLCAGCREGLSLWGGICLHCVGVNIVVLSLLCLLALVGLGLVTALVPSERAVMKNTIDYVQLIALVLVPVPGGRLPSLAALLESNVFNLDISSIFGEGDSGDGGWPANGSFPLVEPPLPPPSLYCPMPLTPLASSLVPLALPLSLLALILLMGFCWRPSADRVCPSSLRACLPGCAACFVEVPSWLLPGSRLVWMVAAPGDVRRVRTSSGPAMVLASLAEPGGDESDGSLASRPDQAVLGHWAYVRSKTVLRAGLRWATVSANVVTATGWGLLACREVDGVQVLELHPAVQCWTPQHIFAVTTMAGFIALFALGLPGFLILAYEWLDKRSAAWEAWRDRRTRFIVRQNALRGHGVMDLFAVRLSRSDVLAAKRHHASEKEEQEEQEAASDSQAGRRERARRAGAARRARSTDAESGSSDDDEEQNAATGVSTPPGLVAAVSGAGRATSPSGVKRHTSAAAVAGTTRLAALPGDRLAGSVAGSPLSEEARHGKESTAFAAAASAGDLELVSSLGRAVWEVMRVYRPGVRGSYEAFVFVRRVLVTSAVVFLATNPTWRQIALFVLSTFFLVIQLLLMPYSTASDNLYASGLLLAMTFICGLEMYNTPLYLSDPNHAASTAALIIAVTEFALLLVPVAIAGTVMIATLRRKGHLACLGRPCQPSGAPCCRPRAGSDAIELSEAPRDTSSLRGVQPGWSVNRE
ncbi:hypothetical protein FNF27_07289 [Cafeteria roenbergensis]|uniref:Receptor ligand binding region domain-containing protein n=1 Tax=Cafeteria roenbergensis TaxID=33653 RepID=A0A5A8DQI3_CAFRO|nr:hypothetical protein FNF27_07289 [Cafeteria roenbergensis]